MEEDQESRPNRKPTAQEVDEFLTNCMDEVALALGLELSDARKKLYLACLRTQSLRALRYAFRQAVLKTAYRSFPLPAELIAWCEEYRTTPEAIERSNRADLEFASQYKQKLLGRAESSDEVVSLVELQSRPEWKEAMKTTRFQRPPKPQTREEFEDRKVMLRDQARLLQGNR